MTRYLAIDFGERRIGLAVGSTGGVSLPLETLVRRNDREAIGDILQAAAREEVDQLVIGEPLQVDGSRGDAAARVQSFAARLRRAADRPVSLHPETLTTVAARERLIEAGVDLERWPERLDAVSAQVLLEDYLAHTTQPLPGAASGGETR